MYRAGIVVWPWLPIRPGATNTAMSSDSVAPRYLPMLDLPALEGPRRTKTFRAGIVVDWSGMASSVLWRRVAVATSSSKGH